MTTSPQALSGRSGSDGEGPRPDTVPAADVRRVDWRFLLPGARLGQVVVVGDCPADLLAALQAHAESVKVDDGELAPHRADVVVTSRPGADALRRAWELLRPGGWLYAERPRRWRRGHLPGRLATDGWSDVALRWHWPSFERGRAVVRLDAPRAGRFALSRQGQGWGTRLAALAVRAGAARALAGPVSIMARKPSSTGPVRSPAAGVSVLLTPSFKASRHLIGLTAAADGTRLTSVLKTPRDADDRTAIDREAANLTDAHRSGGFLDDTAPWVVSFLDEGGRPYLTQTPVNGRPLDRRLVRRDRAAALDAGLVWQLTMPREDESGVGDEHWARLLDEPLGRLASVGGARGAERLELIGRTRVAATPLRAARLPAVFEHGDMSHPNLIVLNDGRLAAVDWELAEPNGLPLHDLAFFVGYLNAATSRPDTPNALADGYRRAIDGPGWARPAFDAYAQALGIERSLVAPLVAVCWARCTARLADVPEALGDNTDHRYEALWRAALTLAEEEA